VHSPLLHFEKKRRYVFFLCVKSVGNYSQYRQEMA